MGASTSLSLIGYSTIGDYSTHTLTVTWHCVYFIFFLFTNCACSFVNPYPITSTGIYSVQRHMNNSSELVHPKEAIKFRVQLKYRMTTAPLPHRSYEHHPRLLDMSISLRKITSCVLSIIRHSVHRIPSYHGSSNEYALWLHYGTWNFQGWRIPYNCQSLLGIDTNSLEMYRRGRCTALMRRAPTLKEMKWPDSTCSRSPRQAT